MSVFRRIERRALHAAASGTAPIPDSVRHPRRHDAFHSGAGFRGHVLTGISASLLALHRAMQRQRSEEVSVEVLRAEKVGKRKSLLLDRRGNARVTRQDAKRTGAEGGMFRRHGRGEALGLGRLWQPEDKSERNAARRETSKRFWRRAALHQPWQR